MKNYYKNRQNSGITLIALVVTIIVLLILAGVSLRLVAGSNGIVERASTAVDETDRAVAKEQVELFLSECVADYYNNGESSGSVEWDETPVATSGGSQTEVTLSLDKSSMEVKTTETGTITATVSPEGTAVTWASDNESVATVLNGVVTGVSEGIAVITATAGTKTASCTVTVSKKMYTITIARSRDTEQMVITFDDTVKTWDDFVKSSFNDGLSVDSSGTGDVGVQYGTGSFDGIKRLSDNKYILWSDEVDPSVSYEFSGRSYVLPPQEPVVESRD